MLLNEFLIRNSRISLFLIVIYMLLNLAGLFIFYNQLDFKFLIYSSYIFFIINFFVMVRYKIIKNNSILLLSALFFSFTFFSVLMQKIFILDVVDDIGRNSWEYIFNIFLVCFLWWGIGFNLANLNIKKNTPYALFVILFLIFFILNNNKGTLLIDYFYVRVMNDDFTITHLNADDYVVFLIIIFGILSRINLFKFWVLMAGMVFFFGGRSAFYFINLSFFICGLLYLIRENKINRKTILNSCFFGAMGIVVSIYYFSSNSYYLENSDLVFRMFLANGTGGDFSINERIKFFEESLAYLVYQIPFGDSSFIAIKFGSMGNYIHNILSAWQFYGFIPFILILIIIYRLIFFINQGNPYISILLCYVILCFLFSRQINFNLFWLIVGYYSNRYLVKVK